MKEFSSNEHKPKLSRLFKFVITNERVGMLFARRKKLAARSLPKAKVKKNRRRIGILRGKVSFGPNFKMTDEEMLGL